MRVVMFYQSLISCWNHGNAHFLRGIVAELVERGHEVRVYEPRDSWSVSNLLRDHGEEPIRTFCEQFRYAASTRYDDSLDLERALDGADLVLVHEWNDPALVASIGAYRARSRSFRLLFHDTHHRAVTAPDEMSRFDLRNYDGVLAFGRVIRDLYLSRGWAERAWTWHEAADVRLFRPLLAKDQQGELVWIGNWGDDERSAELQTFLLDPIRDLALRARVYGVRYPAHAEKAVQRSGAQYCGWLPNHRVPQVLASFRVTVHVPRRPYVESLPGIPTIRPFEAMACGIPLICSPWDDTEQLFEAGHDYLIARDGNEMRRQLRAVLEDRQLADSLATRGRERILARHTCGHRVDELTNIVRKLNGNELRPTLRRTA